MSITNLHNSGWQGLLQQYPPLLYRATVTSVELTNSSNIYEYTHVVLNFIFNLDSVKSACYKSLLFVIRLDLPLASPQRTTLTGCSLSICTKEHLEFS